MGERSIHKLENQGQNQSAGNGLNFLDIMAMAQGITGRDPERTGGHNQIQGGQQRQENGHITQAEINQIQAAGDPVQGHAHNFQPQRPEGQTQVTLAERPDRIDRREYGHSGINSLSQRRQTERRESLSEPREAPRREPNEAAHRVPEKLVLSPEERMGRILQGHANNVLDAFRNPDPQKYEKLLPQTLHSLNFLSAGNNELFQNYVNSVMMNLRRD